MKNFIIDVSLCKGCYACQIACKDEHVDNDWSPYTKSQPETGHFWLHILEKVQGTVPKVRIDFVPKLCMHCDEAPCIETCEFDAINKREDGLVLISPDKCTGCRTCVEGCPHEVIYFNDDLDIAQKCTGCAHLLDHDADLDIPRCVDACPNEAMTFGEESDLQELLAKGEWLDSEIGTQSRVYYLNLPKKFVAGTLYDPVEEEVLIGAVCRLVDKESGETISVMTDHFGDFWFHGLEDDRNFSLIVEKDGNKKIFHNITTETAVNMGDIPLL